MPMQLTSFVHWKRMRLCSSIQYERRRQRKNGCAGFKTAKNSRTLESTWSNSWGRRRVDLPRRAVAARENAINNPPPLAPKPSVPPKAGSTEQPKATAKEASAKKTLKGVIVKRKPKPTSAQKPDQDSPPEAKRRKISIA